MSAPDNKVKGIAAGFYFGFVEIMLGRRENDIYHENCSIQRLRGPLSASRNPQVVMFPVIKTTVISSSALAALH